MIRINLLPVKQDRRREAGRNQIAIGLCVLLLEIAIFVMISMSIGSDIDAQRNKNNIVQAEVTRIQKQISDHQKILDEIKEYEKRQAAIDGLQSARTGPVFVMLELSNILSKNGRPHVDNDKYQEMLRIDSSAGFDENWDYRHLWLSDFKEKDRKVSIKGQAKTHEDVAEFLRRINLSQFFVANELISTDLAKPKLPGTEPKDKKMDPVVHFEVNGEVLYRQKDE
ncbi:MAG: PilN domain-containing protein [Myxococcota bacterium]|nr:PilN domain-containing protein [Myxococcota bacterium]